MTAVQPALFAAPRPPSLTERGIDLRRCDVAEMLASLPDSCADLVIADPPWTYGQQIGTDASEHYECLPISAIAAHVSASARVARRLVVWATWPVLGEWMAAETAWGPPVTGGSWHKSGDGDTGQYGPGFHWAGCGEPVLVYARGKAYNNRAATLRNAWSEPIREHSRKPAGWMAQWLARWVPPGGLVVDMYAGLASVAEAVLLAGEDRRYIGAEISEDRHLSALSLLAQVRA